MKIRRKKKLFFALAAVFSLSALFLILFSIRAYFFARQKISSDSQKSVASFHFKKPEEVRGIYITAYTASTARFEELVNFIKKQGLNTAVLDIKSPKGEPAFLLKNDFLKKYNLQKPIYKPEEIVRQLHQNNIYAIGRLAVFQDPYLVGKEPKWALKQKNGAIWRDFKGVSWLDPTVFAVWRYNLGLAREAYERGFDEIQFDYIRFPSDGNLEVIKYANWDGKTKKEEELEKFFAYLLKIMRRERIPTSADLFGLVCCYNDYDLGIGQVLERALPYFDFVSPMMYPSHYESGFIGKKNPASFPYEVVKYSLERANEKRERLGAAVSVPLGQLRPWIQDFDLGDDYDALKVKAQIRAAREERAEGFLIWNARNVYTNLTN